MVWAGRVNFNVTLGKVKWDKEVLLKVENDKNENFIRLMAVILHKQIKAMDMAHNIAHVWKSHMNDAKLTINTGIEKVQTSHMETCTNLKIYTHRPTLCICGER